MAVADIYTCIYRSMFCCQLLLYISSPIVSCLNGIFIIIYLIIYKWFFGNKDLLDAIYPNTIFRSRYVKLRYCFAAATRRSKRYYLSARKHSAFFNGGYQSGSFSHSILASEEAFIVIFSAFTYNPPSALPNAQLAFPGIIDKPVRQRSHFR